MTKAANTDVSGFTSDRSLRRTCLGLLWTLPLKIKGFSIQERQILLWVLATEKILWLDKGHTHFVCISPPSHSVLRAHPHLWDWQQGLQPPCSQEACWAAPCSLPRQQLAVPSHRSWPSPCPEVSKALPRTLGFMSSLLLWSPRPCWPPWRGTAHYLQPKERKLDTQYCICHSVLAYPFYFKTIIIFNVVERNKDLLYIIWAIPQLEKAKLWGTHTLSQI